MSALLWLLYFTGMESALGTLWAALIVVAGSTLLEGGAVGIAQWRVLRLPLPDLRLAAWWRATTLGALVAWTLGMIPSTIMALDTQSESAGPALEMSDALAIVLAAVMGLVLGPILALPQWWELRRHIAHAWQWIPANAFAWGLGMPVIFAVMALIPTDAISGWTIALILTALAAAGAVVGAIHGVILLRLLPKATRST
jgi:hypothetical protein